MILSIDHGKSDELGSGPNWKKIARFKRLENSNLYFQNDLAFLGRIGKLSLSEFPEIHVLSHLSGRSQPFHHRMRCRLPLPRVPVDRCLRGPRRDRARSQHFSPPHGQLPGTILFYNYHTVFK
jgi:hypothetical protein